MIDDVPDGSSKIKYSIRIMLLKIVLKFCTDICTIAICSTILLVNPECSIMTVSHVGEDYRINDPFCWSLLSIVL